MIEPAWAVAGPDSEDTAGPTAAPLVSLHFLRSALRRAWPVWVGLALTGMVLGAAWTYVMPAKSTGTVTLLLAHDPATDPTQAMATDLAMLRTRAVAEAVIAELDLQMTPQEFQKSVSMSAETTAVLVLAVAATDPEAALTRTETLSSTYLEFRSEQIRSQSSALLDSYQDRLDSLTQRVEALTAEYTAVSSTDPQAQNEATDLLTQRSQLNAEINTLRQIIQDTSTKTSSLVAASHVLDPPSLVPHSDLMRLLLCVASGLIGGLALGVGLVLFKALTSDRLRRREDVALALGAPVRLSVHPPLPGGLWRRVTRRSGAERALRSLARGIESETQSDGGGQVRLALASVDDVRAAELVLACLAVQVRALGKAVFVVDLSESGHLERAVTRALRRVPGQHHDLDAPPVFRPERSPAGAGGLTVVTGEGSPPPDDPRRADWEAAEVVLTLAEVDPAVGLDRLQPWADQVIVVVTAGRSSAERLRTTGRLIRAAGLGLPFAVLVGADRGDESCGLADAADVTWMEHGRRT